MLKRIELQGFQRTASLGLLALLFLPLVVLASPEPVNEVPTQPTGPKRYVTDLGNLIDSRDEATLNTWLAKADKAKVVQMAILTLPTTDRELSLFAPEIMNAWGLGNKETDNGLLVLANASRIRAGVSGNRIFVGTGLGLEGALPDSVVGRVLDREAIPAFKQQAFSQGIVNTTKAYLRILNGDEALKEQYQQPRPQGQREGNWFTTLIWLILILLFLFGPRRGGGIYLGGGGFGGGLGGGGFGGGFGGGGAGGGGAGR